MDPWGNLRLLTLNAKTYKFTQTVSSYPNFLSKNSKQKLFD